MFLALLVTLFEASVYGSPFCTVHAAASLYGHVVKARADVQKAIEASERW
jgi:hypothetical protein